MPRLLHRPPKLRRHKERNLAFVMLDGRKLYLGRWGSSEAKREYARILGEWKAGAKGVPRDEAVEELSVAELLVAFLRHASTYYAMSNEAEHYVYSVRELKRLYSRLPVAEFSPLKLQTVRQAMIDTGLSRRLINQRIRRVKSIFKWGVSQEIVPPAVLHSLLSVRGLAYGRTEVRETDPVKPVPDASVAAVKGVVSPQIRAMIELQELTGMRPGEVVGMRTCDIDTTVNLWIYSPPKHKTAHHGHERRIYLGPQSQSVLKPWLRLNLEEHLFQPCEAGRMAPQTDGCRAENSAQIRKSPRDESKAIAETKAIESIRCSRLPSGDSQGV